MYSMEIAIGKQIAVKRSLLSHLHRLKVHSLVLVLVPVWFLYRLDSVIDGAH